MEPPVPDAEALAMTALGLPEAQSFLYDSTYAEMDCLLALKYEHNYIEPLLQ